MRILVTSIVDLERVPYNRIHVLLNHLCQKHEITALCLNAWWLEKQGIPGANGESRPDPYFRRVFEKVEIIYPTEKRISAILQEVSSPVNLPRLLRKLDYADFDLHVNYSSLASGLVVSRSLRARGIPTVFDVADDLPAAFRVSSQVPHPLQWLSGFISAVLFDANVRMAARITVVTQALQSRYHLPTQRTVCLPNGFDETLFRECPTGKMRQEVGLSSGDFVVGFVGNLRGWIDLSPVFAAVQGLKNRVPRMKLLIVGSGEALKRNKDMVAEYDIDDRVLFTGNVAHEQVPRYISCMDVCTIPFADEAVSAHASPIKLLEYMACGRPVISRPLAGVIEIAGERVLYAADEQEWAGRVLELYEDADLRARMGTAGRGFVKDKYSWSQICQQFEEVLFEAASAARSTEAKR